MIKDIYFLNTRELARKLANGEIYDDTAIKNILALTIIFGAIYQFPIHVEPLEPGEEIWNSLYSTISWIVSAIISYFGIRTCYSTAKKHNVNNFLKTFSTLALPVSVNITLIFLLLFFVILIAGYKILGAHFAEIFPY